jgi:vitamin B12 transporter
MKKKIFIVAAVLFSSQVFSQQQDSTVVELDEFPWSNAELTRVVVTANKFPRKQSETGKVLTVINRSQLERSIGKSLSELLNTVAGTTIIGANNNLGTNQTTSIRGSSAGNVLILIDGVPANDPSVITNYFDLNLISIDQVERIEILKGGQSTLYGSDAVMGVINIIMRSPAQKKLAISGSLSGGSYGTFKQNLGVSGSAKSARYSLNYTHLGAKGFSAANDALGSGDFDKDGYDQHAVNGRSSFQLSKKLQLTIAGMFSTYKADLDYSGYIDEKDFTVDNTNGQVTTGLALNHKRGNLRFNYNFNYVSREYVDDSGYKATPFSDYSETRFIGRTHFAEMYNNWKWETVELLAGVDYRFNNTDQYSLYLSSFPSGPSYLKAKMSQVSPYASVIFNNDEGLVAELGGRLNQHSEYGTNFSFTFNPSYRVSDKAKFFANLYSAFKAPTLYQLFDPFAGNTSLEPEKAIVGELGVELFKGKEGWARVTGFYRNTKNSIQYILIDPVFFTSQYRNVSSQKNYGVEVEASYKIANWNFTANYTYTDGKTRSGYDGTGAPIGKDTTYYNLYRIPKNAFNIGIEWAATKKLFLSTHLRAIGSREEFIYGGSPQKLESYMTIDLYGEYAFNKKIKVFLDLKNITNETYFDIPGYNSRKRNFMAGVHFNL